MNLNNMCEDLTKKIIKVENENKLLNKIKDGQAGLIEKIDKENKELKLEVFDLLIARDKLRGLIAKYEEVLKRINSNYYSLRSADVIEEICQIREDVEKLFE